jgi:hypothetical protein
VVPTALSGPRVPQETQNARIDLGFSLVTVATCGTPSLLRSLLSSITESSHQYLNHTYYWPAKTEWNEVDITLVDPVEPDLSGDLISTIQEAGFRIPGGTTNPSDFSTPSKKGFVDATGIIVIEQIDEEGNSLEKWTLWHAWVKEVTFGELNYGSEDLTEVMVKFRYDWAQFDSETVANAFTV